ncbi:hypothetical protein BSKO_04535 [Bryopsis sp. KO-2023]|nr:hypothetical protein BSKO_04535 [Bryopsis sp. KO-2023]
MGRYVVIVAALLVFILLDSTESRGTRRRKPLPAWATKIHRKGTCASYNVCGKNEHGFVPCPANIEFQPIEDSAASLMKKHCPSLWHKAKRSRKACCTKIELDDVLSSANEWKEYLLGCPACWKSFVDFWCMMVCSPDQSTFTDVKAVKELKRGDENPLRNLWQTGISEMNVHVDNDVKSALYRSCKDVKFRGRKAMRKFSNAKNGDQFLAAIGNSVDKGGKLAFQINFPTRAPRNITPLKMSVLNCWDGGAKCKCSDCPASCPSESLLYAS